MPLFPTTILPIPFSAGLQRLLPPGAGEPCLKGKAER